MFATDPERAERYVVTVGDLRIDYSQAPRSRTRPSRLLQELATATGVFGLRDAMFRGEKINVTEDRAVLHTALRAPRDAVIEVDGENVVPAVHAVLDKMANFADRVRFGEWTGHTGQPYHATSSTSASVAPIWVPPWRTRLCARSPTAS
ncbi:hypothetical protein ACRAWF_03695 [Streptomyces sp. L7]